MIKNKHIAFLAFLLFSFGNHLFAQENPDAIALVDDQLENNFYEAMKQRGIENYDKAIINYVRNKEIDKDIKDNLREMMWTYASIVRDPKTLQLTLDTIEGYLTLNVGRLLFLRLLTAKSILNSALRRKKSLGAHYIKEN